MYGREEGCNLWTLNWWEDVNEVQERAKEQCDVEIQAEKDKVSAAEQNLQAEKAKLADIEQRLTKEKDDSLASTKT